MADERSGDGRGQGREMRWCDAIGRFVTEGGRGGSAQKRRIVGAETERWTDAMTKREMHMRTCASRVLHFGPLCNRRSCPRRVCCGGGGGGGYPMCVRRGSSEALSAERSRARNAAGGQRWGEACSWRAGRMQVGARDGQHLGAKARLGRLGESGGRSVGTVLDGVCTARQGTRSSSRVELGVWCGGEEWVVEGREQGREQEVQAGGSSKSWGAPGAFKSLEGSGSELHARARCRRVLAGGNCSRERSSARNGTDLEAEL